MTSDTHANEAVSATLNDTASITEPGPEPAATALRILKTGECPSLSGNSTLTYAIGCSSDGVISFCIVANSGGGLFNKEWIAHASVVQLLEALPKGEPIRASTFLPLFHGKSVNTAGFLTAVLHHEKLLQPLVGKPRCYELLALESFTDELNALRALPVSSEGAPPSTPVRSKTLSLKSLKHKAKHK